MAFQTAVTTQQAPGVEGDFASMNPRHAANSMPGGFVSGPNGVFVGRFAWADTATGTILSNSGTGAPTGFVARTMQALVTAYPAKSGLLIPAGQAVGDIFKGGDFWARQSGAANVAIGMKVFANNTTGVAAFAAAGATVAGHTETKWFAQSIGGAGELIKITTVPLG